MELLSCLFHAHTIVKCCYGWGELLIRPITVPLPLQCFPHPRLPKRSLWDMNSSTYKITKACTNSIWGGSSLVMSAISPLWAPYAPTLENLPDLLRVGHVGDGLLLVRILTRAPLSRGIGPSLRAAPSPTFPTFPTTPLQHDSYSLGANVPLVVDVPTHALVNCSPPHEWPLCRYQTLEQNQYGFCIFSLQTLITFLKVQTKWHYDI